MLTRNCRFRFCFRGASLLGVSSQLSGSNPFLDWVLGCLTARREPSAHFVLAGGFINQNVPHPIFSVRMVERWNRCHVFDEFQS